MEVVIAALLASGFITLTAHLWRKNDKKSKERDVTALLDAPDPERGLDALEVGDILVYDGRDLIVSEVWVFSRGTHRWREYLLDEEGEQRWLVADTKDSDGVCLGAPFLRADEAPSEALDHEGVIYRLEGSGSSSATVDESPRGEVRFWDYGCPGSGCACGGTLSVDAVGERVRRHLIDVLPGS